MLTLVFVFAGAVPLAPWLAGRPMAFAVFWLGGFLLVVAVLVMALQDLSRVRREHRRRIRDLERELSEIAAEAREEMERREGRGEH